MKIYFVIGISCSGKSKYIEDNFKDTIVVDLLDFQQNLIFLTQDSIMESYQQCMDELIKQIKENKDKDIDIVLEHTMLKAIRRKVYIDAVKEVCDTPITAIVINPPMEVLKERSVKRGYKEDEQYIQSALDILEIPTIEEGFDSVKIIKE